MRSPGGSADAEHRIVDTALLVLQGYSRPAKGLQHLQISLSTSGFSGYKNVLRDFLISGQQRRLLERFAEDGTTNAGDAVLQAFSIELRAMLWQMNAQLASLATISSKACQENSEPSGARVATSDHFSLLQLLHHTDAIRNDVARLAGMCGLITPELGALVSRSAAATGENEMSAQPGPQELPGFLEDIRMQWQVAGQQGLPTRHLPGLAVMPSLDELLQMALRQQRYIQAMEEVVDDALAISAPAVRELAGEHALRLQHMMQEREAHRLEQARQVHAAQQQILHEQTEAIADKQSKQLQDKADAVREVREAQQAAAAAEAADETAAKVALAEAGQMALADAEKQGQLLDWRMQRLQLSSSRADLLRETQAREQAELAALPLTKLQQRTLTQLNGQHINSAPSSPMLRKAPVKRTRPGPTDSGAHSSTTPSTAAPDAVAAPVAMVLQAHVHCPISVLYHCTSRLCLGLLWGALGLGDLLSAYHLVACMGAGDFADALAHRLLSHPAASAAHLQAALDASLQESCAPASNSFVRGFKLSAMVDKALTVSQDQLPDATQPDGLPAAAFDLDVFEHLQLTCQGPDAVMAAISQPAQQHYSVIFKQLLRIRATASLLDQLWKDLSTAPQLLVPPTKGSAARHPADGSGRKGAKVAALMGARHKAAHIVQALQAHMYACLDADGWTAKSAVLKDQIEDLQQLRSNPHSPQYSLAAVQCNAIIAEGNGRTATRQL
ncbi:hypothetical protein WJX73_001443 [Symbiochloris irregularis]|uniref:Gamma-tubulin complex component n=1 Tax=Symbiochloris irregularis TaxID=706552 RepID=A0AAW1P0C0_9CHLO